MRRYDDPLFKAAADQTLLTRHDRFCRSHSKTLYLLINCARVHAADLLWSALFICTLPLFSTDRLLICYIGTIIQRRRIRLLGASAIVFMLIMLSNLAGSRNGGIPITLFLVGALYLSQQVYDILFVQDNVANFMHIVGGACGTVFGFAVRRK